MSMSSFSTINPISVVIFVVAVVISVARVEILPRLFYWPILDFPKLAYFFHIPITFLSYNRPDYLKFWKICISASKNRIFDQKSVWKSVYFSKNLYIILKYHYITYKVKYACKNTAKWVYTPKAVHW